MTIRTPDGREIVRAERADAAIAALKDGCPAWLDREIALGKAFLEIDEKHAYYYESAASTAELAARQGYDAYRVLDLLLLARAIKAEPKVEALLRAEKIIFQAACALGRILPHPEYLQEGDDWLHVAQFKSLQELRRRIGSRIEKVKRQRKDLRRYTLMVDDLAEFDLERCHELVMDQEKNHGLTRGETIPQAIREWLEKNDPLEKAVGTRRVGPTSERPGDRYVPRAVVAEIYRRSGGFCEVGGCTRTIQQICHIKAHAAGGDREARSLFGGCNGHHVLYDAKPAYLMFLEWTKEGRPVFFNRRNESIHPVPRPVRDIEPPSEWLLQFVDPAETAPTHEMLPDAPPVKSAEVPAPTTSLGQLPAEVMPAEVMDEARPDAAKTAPPGVATDPAEPSRWYRPPPRRRDARRTRGDERFGRLRRAKECVPAP